MREVLGAVMHWSKRITAEIVLVAHGIGAVGWWWLTPGGFPLNHSRFWLNQVWPIVQFAIAVIGLVALARRKPELLTLILLACAMMWIACVDSARLVFPITTGKLWIWPFVISVAVLGWLLKKHYGKPRSRRTLLIASLIGVVIGAFPVWAVRGPDASTHPLVLDVADESSPEGEPKVVGAVSLSESVNVMSASGLVSIQHGEYRLQIEPLLSFEHISPDRCWSLLIPKSHRHLPPRRITEVRKSDGDSDDVRIQYNSRESLSVVSIEPKLINITAARTLNEAGYSHLNSFCVLHVTGHRRLFLRFSPCREARIEVLPADYPTGRPARFAYRTTNRFFVVEATSGEKGPFRELASGSLSSVDPIVLWLEDDDRSIGSITFDDWATQASTELSPTAGWGVPQNAIEFQRTGDEPSASGMIWLTLAATSVGRGWDSVGHSPGNYRNQMQVRFQQSEKPHHHE